MSVIGWIECVYLSGNRFLRHGKTEFELPVLFLVYPPHRKRYSKIDFFYFLFLTTLDFQVLFSYFVFFFFDFEQQNSIKKFTAWLVNSTLNSRESRYRTNCTAEAIWARPNVFYFCVPRQFANNENAFKSMSMRFHQESLPESVVCEV